MAITITIQGTEIEFPSSGGSPDWASAVDQFAVAVEEALSNVVGTYDISPQQFVLDSVPNATATNITNLSFSPSVVSGAEVRYSVYRNTSLETVSESGKLLLVYNSSNGVGEKWEIAREAVGDADVTFTISDTGQIQITTTALSGTGYNGYVSFAGQALQVSY